MHLYSLSLPPLFESLKVWQTFTVRHLALEHLNNVLVLSDGELYSATVSDFSASDPLIYKEPLRTGQADSKHLSCELGFILSSPEGYYTHSSTVV